MRPFVKTAAALGMVSALALAVTTESQARNSWIGPAAAGFAVGAIVGGAVANSNARYYDGYYDGYAYAPSYGYDAYGYAPGYGYERTYVRPRYRYNNSGPHQEDQLTGTGIGASQ